VIAIRLPGSQFPTPHPHSVADGTVPDRRPPGDSPRLRGAASRAGNMTNLTPSTALSANPQTANPSVQSQASHATQTSNSAPSAAMQQPNAADWDEDAGSEMPSWVVQYVVAASSGSSGDDALSNSEASYGSNHASSCGGDEDTGSQQAKSSVICEDSSAGSISPCSSGDEGDSTVAGGCGAGRAHSGRPGSQGADWVEALPSAPKHAPDMKPR